MPHIVSPAEFKTKKSFKQAVMDGKDPYCSDPSIFGGAISGTVSEILAQKDDFTVTNHPKRSWYARVYKGRNGKVRVS